MSATLVKNPTAPTSTSARNYVHAMVASFLGWTLDAFDFFSSSSVLPRLRKNFTNLTLRLHSPSPSLWLDVRSVHSSSVCLPTGVVQLLFALLLAPALRAQTSHWEITPFAGFETGASVTATDPKTGQPAFPIDRIGIGRGRSYGLFVDYSRWEPLQFEFMWNMNSSAHTRHDALTQQAFVTRKTHIDQYQFGIAWPFLKDKPLEPYVAMGFGLTRDANAAGKKTSFSFSAGGGVKYYYSRHVGIRGEVRLIPSYANSAAGEICLIPNESVVEACSEGQISQFFHRVNISGGLIFRF